MPMVVPSSSLEITQMNTIDQKIVVSMVEHCAAYWKKKQQTFRCIFNVLEMMLIYSAKLNKHDTTYLNIDRKYA